MEKSKVEKVPPRRPVWNIWQGIFLILVINAIEWPLGWLESPQDLNTLGGLLRFIGIGVGEGLIYLTAIIMFFRLIRRPLSELGLVKVRRRFLVLGLITGVVLFVGIGLLGNILQKVLGTPAPQSFALAVKGADYGFEFALLLLLGGLIAPLKEEILFRGLIYPPLRRSFGRGKGMLITGFFFAVLHLDMIRFLPLFIGGVILTWLYERSSSLWPCIIAHGTWNVLMALALWIQR